VGGGAGWAIGRPVDPDRRGWDVAAAPPIRYDGGMTPRITSDPGICGGKPCIRHMRIRVRDIMEMLAGGDTVETILAEFDFLDREDILAAFAFAATTVDHPVFAVAAE